MSYPVDAFVRASPDTAPKGTLMYVRDFWILTAEIPVPTGTKRKSLILTGANSGKYFDALQDESALAIAPGVTFELRVADPTSRVANGTYPPPAAAVVPADGAPQIWLRHPDSEHSRRGFYLDGTPVQGEEHEHRPFVYLSSYEVWLTREGKPLDDKPLFTVG